MVYVVTALLGLVLFLVDVAIFFLGIRVLTRILPWKPLHVLDRIGSAGVTVVTDAVAYYAGRWCEHPLRRRTQEVLALLVLSIARVVLSVLLQRI